ncbi:MAG: PP2C family protein-serine/threonine phosphatase, partial [Candidatus Zixiibacteriota bacterium]
MAEQKSGSAGPTSKQDRVFELEAELDHQRERLEDIKTMGAVIASILEMERALPVMMEMTLRTVNGEVGAILLEEDDELFAKVAWGLDQALLDRLEVEGGLLLKQAYSNGWETLCLNNCDLAPGSGLKVASLLAAPISSHERRHGLTVVLNKERGGEFTQDDLASLQSLNHFLAVAIENARLFEETLEKQRLDQELEIARQVQQTILPDATLSHPGFEIGAVYVAAHQVGGDFYELIPLPDGSFVLIVGDVSNKGVAAALVMSACSGIIKSLLRTDPQMRMCHLAASLNDTLAEGVVKDKGMFATIWFGRFDPGGQGLAYCNAGHLPPLWRAAGNGEITELSAGGPIVGQFEGITFTEGHVQLSAGDSITLFTDGLTEAEDRDGQLFGRERAQAFVEEFTDL